MKKPFKIDNIRANKILVSKREQYCTKNSFSYFTGYDDNDAIRPLCVKLPQMNVKHFDSNITMSFKVTDKKLQKKYTKIRRKISSSMKKRI